MEGREGPTQVGWERECCFEQVASGQVWMTRAMWLVLVTGWANASTRPSKSNGFKNKAHGDFSTILQSWCLGWGAGCPLCTHSGTQADGCSTIFKFWLPRSSRHHHLVGWKGKELERVSWEFSMAQSECDRYHLCPCSIGVNLVTWSSHLWASLPGKCTLVMCPGFWWTAKGRGPLPGAEGTAGTKTCMGEWVWCVKEQRGSQCD